MNMRTLERIKQQWLFAADAMPQLICLVNRDGRVIRANRTLERWGLGQVGAVSGAYLHEVLHKRCSDPDCYLRLFGRRAVAALAQDRRTQCNAWDPVLKRHFEIRVQVPVREPEAEAAAEDFFAVVTVDDVTELKNFEEQSRRSAQILGQRVEREERKGAAADKEPAHLHSKVPAHPFTKIAAHPRSIPEVNSPPGRDIGEWVRTEEALRATQNQLRLLSAQHLTIRESERRRIAVDLHDGLGQTLSLIKLSIDEAARSASAGNSEKVAAMLVRLAPTVKSALAELRRISMNLRPSTLDDLGILATLSWYFREFEATCPNIILERDIRVKESDVPELLKIAIFRIVQEATGNALKHAGADRIKVSLSNARDSLELLIEDSGRGFDPAAAAGRRDFNGGLGLQSMKERAELSGASYEMQSAPGKGTSIRARWPSPEAFERKLAAKP